MNHLFLLLQAREGFDLGYRSARPSASAAAKAKGSSAKGSRPSAGGTQKRRSSAGVGLLSGGGGGSGHMADPSQADAALEYEAMRALVALMQVITIYY